MNAILGVVIGGAAGALARWGLTLALLRSAERLPWGTLAVNLSGCLAAGFIDAAAARRGWDARTRTALLAGFCGSYTTLSALVAQLDQLLRTKPLAGAAYAAATLLGGLALLRAGAALGAR